MTKSIELTAADTNAHNLYALILAELGVTQLPQRVDLGDVFFPDFVAKVTFFLDNGNPANSGNTLQIQDQSGNEITSILPAIPYSIGSGNQNNVSLQSLQIEASASGVVTNVSIEQI